MGGQAKEGVIASKLLRRHGLNLMAFAFVAGYRNHNPNADVIQAVAAFQLHFNITDDEWKAESIVREVHRMTFEYLRDGV